MKMPGPKGVITVSDNRKKEKDCLQDGVKITDEQMTAVEFQEYQKTADPSDLMRAKRPASKSAF